MVSNALDTKQLENGCGNTSRLSNHNSYTPKQTIKHPASENITTTDFVAFSVSLSASSFPSPTTFYASRLHVINVSLSQQNKTHLFISIQAANRKALRLLPLASPHQTNKLRLIMSYSQPLRGVPLPKLSLAYPPPRSGHCLNHTVGHSSHRPQNSVRSLHIHLQASLLLPETVPS